MHVDHPGMRVRPVRRAQRLSTTCVIESIPMDALRRPTIGQQLDFASTILDLGDEADID